MLAPARESARGVVYKVHRPPITLEKTEQVPMALFLVYDAIDGGCRGGSALYTTLCNLVL